MEQQGIKSLQLQNPEANDAVTVAVIQSPILTFLYFWAPSYSHFTLLVINKVWYLLFQATPFLSLLV